MNPKGVQGDPWGAQMDSGGAQVDPGGAQGDPWDAQVDFVRIGLIIGGHFASKWPQVRSLSTTYGLPELIRGDPRGSAGLRGDPRGSDYPHKVRLGPQLATPLPRAGG